MCFSLISSHTHSDITASSFSSLSLSLSLSSLPQLYFLFPQATKVNMAFSRWRHHHMQETNWKGGQNEIME